MCDLFALLFSSACAYGVEKSQKAREMAEVEEDGACEYLVGQEADGCKGADVESPKRSVKCESGNINGINFVVVGVDKE